MDPWLSFLGPIVVALLGTVGGLWLVRSQRKKLEAEAEAVLTEAKAKASSLITDAAVQLSQESREELSAMRKRLRALEEQSACYHWVLEKLLTGTSLAQTRKLAKEHGVVERLERTDGGLIADLLRECKE